MWAAVIDAVVDDAAVLLFASYGLAGLLLLLYFVWEDGPFHYSQRVESTYLCVTLLLIYFASTFFTEAMLLRNEELCLRDMQMRSSITVCHLMMLCVMINIMNTFVKCRMMAGFYDNISCRDVKQAEQLNLIPIQHPSVERIVQELEDTMREIIRVDGNRVMEEVFVRALGPVLLLLHVLMNLVEASEVIHHGMRSCQHITWMGRCVQLVVIIVALYKTISRWVMLGPQVQRLEQQIEPLVTEGRFTHLQYVLATVSVGTLLSVSRRVKFLLAETAVEKGLLSTHSKAIIIDALQRVGLKSKRNQTAVKRIFETTYRSQLTVLKNLLDGRGDYHNLFKLVYQDISHPGIQNDIIKHLIDEAQLAREQLGQAAGIKVLSDIDDTLYSSGGRFPAGCDKQFPKGVVYPGCLTLFNALDKGFTIGVPSCNLVFVSARPHVYKSWAEEKSYKLFRSLMEQQRIHTFPTLLPGNLKSSLLATIWACFRRTTAWRDVGERKYDIYQHYVRLYLEYEFVFCGDDGQGDLFAGQRMLSNGARRTCLDEHAACSDEDSAEGDSSEEEHGRCVEEVSVEDSIGTTLATSHSGEVKEGSPLAVLIHEVSQHGQLTRLLSQPLEETQPRLIFHRTYVGAAVDLNAIRPDLVTAKDVQEVANDAVQEFERTRIVYPDMLQSLQEAEVDLLADLDRARTVIQAAGLDEVRRLRSRSVMDTRFREENWELIQTRTMPTAVGPTDSLTVRVPTRHQSH